MSLLCFIYLFIHSKSNFDCDQEKGFSLKGTLPPAADINEQLCVWLKSNTKFGKLQKTKKKAKLVSQHLFYVWT